MLYFQLNGRVFEITEYKVGEDEPKIIKAEWEDTGEELTESEKEQVIQLYPHWLFIISKHTN